METMMKDMGISAEENDAFFVYPGSKKLGVKLHV